MTVDCLEEGSTFNLFEYDFADLIELLKTTSNIWSLSFLYSLYLSFNLI